MSVPADQAPTPTSPEEAQAPENVNGDGTQPESTEGTPANDADVSEQQPAISFPSQAAFKARMEREAQSRLKKEAEALGYDSVDAMKAAIAGAQKREEAELSEADRLAKRLKDLENKEATWQSEREAIIRNHREQLGKYQVMLAAQKMQFKDPEDPFVMIGIDSIEFDDNGEPTNIDALLTALVEKKPYLIDGTGNPKAPPATPKATTAELSEEQKRKQAARLRGL